MTPSTPAPLRRHRWGRGRKCTSKERNRPRGGKLQLEGGGRDGQRAEKGAGTARKAGVACLPGPMPLSGGTGSEFRGAMRSMQRDIDSGEGCGAVARVTFGVAEARPGDSNTYSFLERARSVDPEPGGEQDGRR